MGWPFWSALSFISKGSPLEKGVREIFRFSFFWILGSLVAAIVVETWVFIVHEVAHLRDSAGGSCGLWMSFSQQERCWAESDMLKQSTLHSDSVWSLSSKKQKGKLRIRHYVDNIRFPLKCEFNGRRTPGCGVEMGPKTPVFPFITTTSVIRTIWVIFLFHQNW